MLSNRKSKPEKIKHMVNFLKGNDIATRGMAPVNGQHSQLDARNVFLKSHEDAITPASPGSWESFRFTPALNQVRTFSQAEADALTNKADESKQMVKSSVRGYKALMRMSKYSYQINDSFEKYRRVEAKNEYKMQREKQESALVLHQLRPKYARLGRNLEQAKINAGQAIANLAASLST